MDTMTLPKRPKRIRRTGQTSLYVSAARTRESRTKTILTETLYGTLFFTGIMLGIAAVYVGAAVFVL